jgi:hypothetical protein
MKNWRGWATIGAILMMVVGVFQILSGIFGLVNDQWVVLGYTGYFLVDVTGLAVWYIAIGAVLLLGGMYVIRGAAWARVVGVVAASLAIVSQLFMLPVHPIWSILLLALYVLALIGFVAMDGPLEPLEAEPVWRRPSSRSLPRRNRLSLRKRPFRPRRRCLSRSRPKRPSLPPRSRPLARAPDSVEYGAALILDREREGGSGR